MIRPLSNMLTIIPIIFIITTINCAENRNQHGTLIYEDLKCKPEPTENGINTYKCDDLKLSNDTCLFQAKHYKIGESVPNELTYGACQVGCFCDRQNNESVGFTCAVLDCPEFPLNHSCHYTYTPGKCCTTGKICEDTTNSTEIKCEVDGVTYRKGERFHPKNTCMDCVCLEGFENVFEEPFCKPRICATQIRNSRQLSEYCAPLYHFEKTFCCPDDWVCPNGTEQLTNLKNETPYKCQFGDKLIPHGASFNTVHNQWDEMIETTCECVVPPFLTCYNKNKE